MRSWFRSLSLIVLMALIGGACSKKASVKNEVTELEKAFPVADVSSAPAPPSSISSAATPIASQQQDVNELVRAALAAARANDYAAGVVALDAAQSKPGLTVDQVMAAQRAQKAMAIELHRRAANGDQDAISQLKKIEKTRSQ